MMTDLSNAVSSIKASIEEIYFASNLEVGFPKSKASQHLIGMVVSYGLQSMLKRNGYQNLNMVSLFVLLL